MEHPEDQISLTAAAPGLELLAAIPAMRALVEQVPTCIAVFDTAMCYLMASRRHMTDFALAVDSPAELVGRSHYDVFPGLPEHRREVYRRVLAGETLADSLDSFIRADGRTEWLRWKMSPWRHGDGTIGGAFLVSEVITARKQSEFALIENEARLRRAQMAGAVGSWEWWVGTDRVHWSDGLRVLLGLPLDAPASHSGFLARVHPDDREKLVAVLANLASDSASPVETVYRICRADTGEERWLAGRSNIEPGPDGRPLRVLGVTLDVTEKRRAEDMLRAAEARFRAVFDAAPIALSLIDPQTLRFIDFNDMACAGLGYTREEYAAMRASDLTVGVGREAMLARHFPPGARPVYEFRMRARSGEINDALVSAARLMIDGQELICAARIDVTQARERERERLRLADQQSAILDAMPAQIALLDGAGRIVAVNAAWRDFAAEGCREGCAPPTDVGADYLATCLPAAAAGDLVAISIVDGLHDVLAGQRQRLEATYFCPGPDGSERWFRLLATPVRHGAAGSGAVVVHIDITSQVRDRRAIEEREARLESILETVPDAMMAIDENGTIESFSSAAKRMFGWSAAEAMGRNIAILMPEPDAGAHNDHVERYRATGERHVIGRSRIVTGQRRGGACFPMELTVGEVKVGGRTFFTGFARDLTNQHETQARLRDLQAELLHVSRLRETGMMASALSHELNQPLTSVIAALQAARRMLNERPVSAKSASFVHEAIELATEQSLRAGGIIRNLREFVSRGTIQRQSENVTRLVEDAATLALVGIQHTPIRVSFDLDPALPPVLADRVQLQQVLFNLLRNAVQAMTDAPAAPGAPPPTLHVRALHVPGDLAAEPGHVEIIVADTGSGLAPEIAGRLFEPFVTTKPTGMGVGLSICRAIVEAHEGRIRAAANPGGGTVFHVILPSAPAEAHATMEPAP